MRTVRLVLLVCAALVLPSLALAQDSAQSKAPTGLKPFLLRASESAARDFPRTPSFSWSPVRGATRYEFELSKTAGFQEGTIFWSSSALKSPAVAVPLTLPWMTGAPFAAYARVRAWTRTGPTAWGSAYGFNLRWTDIPKPTVTAHTGLASWTPVDGATSYQVWFPDVGRVVETRVTSVDERELYAFHQTPAWTSAVHWRVRAVRRVAKLQGFITPVNYGPWSPTYTANNPPLDTGALRLVAAVTARATTVPGKPGAHEVTPAFVFTGTHGLDGNSYGLYRVYVFSDQECVNPIFRGAIVGSPAYAPRNKGTLVFPTDDTAVVAAASTLLPVGDEGTTWTADGAKVRATEAGTAAGPASGSAAGAPAAPSVAPAPGASTAPTSEGTSDPATNSDWARIELLDSGWPTGRFFWTVVPVKLVPKLDATGKVASWEYRDAEVAQDACAAGRVMAFGKASSPVVAAAGSPYASGLSPTGRLVAASGNQVHFYGNPLVAWRPAVGADTYQVEWSRTRYPWRTAARLPDVDGTATSLPLGGKPGVWWYRIRGIDSALPLGHQFMTWSAPLQLTVAKPKFRLIASSK